MAIHRSGPVPPYLNYLLEYPLVAYGQTPSQNVLTAASTGQLWLDIPRYQRGISWDVDDVESLLRSDSILLGNVIIGQFDVSLQPLSGGHLPSGVGQYGVLVDGLQRFAVGTALLNVLHGPVLSTSPTRPGDASHFAPLQTVIGARSAIYQHNDRQLGDHPRKAVADQYLALRGDLAAYVNKKLDDGEAAQLAAWLIDTTLQKQIAIDIYFAFNDPIKLMNTFLGLNTVRVDLGPVDLVRAIVVERATSAGWNATDVEDVENRFSEVFLRNDKPDAALLPFVNVVLNALRDAKRATLVFPSWSGQLLLSEVDTFIEFVQSLRDVKDNGYLTEIRECGSIPFAMVLGHYYAKLLAAGGVPSFLNAGTSEDPDLHALLLACYRTFLDRNIGRTRDYADKCLAGSYATLHELADDLSKTFLHLPVSAPVDRAWLIAALNRVDRSKSRRVFNALLLAPRKAGFGSVPLTPLRFGSSAQHAQVDHLIAEKNLHANQHGGAEGQTLRNFAPLPTKHNREAKHNTCSYKLGTGGPYEKYAVEAGAAVHPYCKWLVANQASLGGNLDKQELLQLNRLPAIGDDRIGWIADQLMDRL